MPIEICNAFGPNCVPDWNGVAAIATVGATAIALFLPFWTRRKDKDEKNAALAHSLLFKMAKIHSDMSLVWKHVEESRLKANADDEHRDTCMTFLPWANIPQPVVFNTDELTLLFSARNNEVFNSVLTMDDLHNGDMVALKVYAEKRAALMEKFPGAEMDGTVGNVSLTSEQYLKINPFIVELNVLVKDICKNAEVNFNQSKAALADLVEVLKRNFGMKISAEIPRDKQP